MKKALFLAPLFAMWLTAPVWAVEPGLSANSAEVNRPLSKTSTASEDNLKAKCEVAESKINFRINQYEQSRDKHYSVYQGVRKRLGDLAAKYEGQGCDVSALKSDLTKFDSLIQDFGTSFRAFIGSMQDVRNYQCGDVRSKFGQSTQQARQKLVTVKQKSEAVRQFFKSTIQPRLSQKIKECSASPKPEKSNKPMSSPAVKNK